MSKFKVGDKVRCVLSCPGYLKGQTIYEVDALDRDRDFLRVKGLTSFWDVIRFELVEPGPVEPEPVEPAPAHNQAVMVDNTLALDAVRAEWDNHASQILARYRANPVVLPRHDLPRSHEPTDRITRSEHQTRWGLMRVEFNRRTRQAVFMLDPAEGVEPRDPTITHVETEAPAWGGSRVHDTNTAAAVAAAVSGEYLEPNRTTMDRAQEARQQERAAAEAARLPGPGTACEWGEP